MNELKEKVIGVLMGGMSAEREISMKSGKAVSNALIGLGYNIREIDVTRESIGRLADEELDIAFIALHGRFGEDGTIQGMLEMMRIPYTGSSHTTSAVALNKLITKQLMKYNNIQVTPFEAITIDEYRESGCTKFIDNIPVVVKPINEGSSIGISIVKSAQQLKPALDLAFTYDDTVLVEKYIKAREIQVGVLNNKPLGIIEIVPKNEFYDFDAKYSDGGAKHIFPAPLDVAVHDMLMERALMVHKILGCSGATRVDFLLDDNNEAYLLEVNTLPGMTELSLLPEIADGVGIPFPKLCEEILKGASLHVNYMADARI